MTPRRILAIVVLAGGCYSTTPHQARVESVGSRASCAAAVRAVFDRAGFIQLSSPPQVSMFFGPRMSGPYTSALPTGVGVGVTFGPNEGVGGSCDVTLEALSADAECPDSNSPFSCSRPNDPALMSRGSPTSLPPCPIAGTTRCALSYAPGADNDAVVDELARRLRVELSPRSRDD